MRVLTASQLDAILINFIFSGVFTFCSQPICTLLPSRRNFLLWLSAPLKPISTYITSYRLEIPFALTDSGAPYLVESTGFFKTEVNISKQQPGKFNRTFISGMF